MLKQKPGGSDILIEVDQRVAAVRAESDDDDAVGMDVGTHTS